MGLELIKLNFGHNIYTINPNKTFAKIKYLENHFIL